jgi:hypothetical protein
MLKVPAEGYWFGKSGSWSTKNTELDARHNLRWGEEF